MKRHAPAAARNQGPILEVLQRVLPPAGRALEVASGSGQHVVAFAAAMREWSFVPSDPDPAARASIDAWIAQSGCPNVAAAVDLDARRWPWPVTHADAIFAANMVHISPWEATVGLLVGAGRVLASGGRLVVYGPFVIDGATAPSNRAFDESLRARDPAWGVRDLEALQTVAAEAGLTLHEVVAMPANNHCVVWAAGPTATPPSGTLWAYRTTAAISRTTSRATN
ncbi:MAG: DUF938 domain-containing protein [Myxococcota bacterium]